MVQISQISVAQILLRSLPITVVFADLELVVNKAYMMFWEISNAMGPGKGFIAMEDLEGRRYGQGQELRTL